MWIIASLVSLPVLALAHSGKKVVWTAVFTDTQPNAPGISEQYCRAHTPTVMVTTIKQITGKRGVRAINGVNVRYLSYKTREIHGIYFNIVNAIIRGKIHGKAWSTPMKLYEQTLSPTGVTNTVWATQNCKGKFVGTATVLNGS
mgnify:CR=1 FL=1